MTTHPSTLPETGATSRRQASLLAALASFIMFGAAMIAEMYMRQRLIVPGDETTTSATVLAHSCVFRLGIFCFLLVLVCDVLASWALYVFFKPVHESLSLLVMLFRLVYTALFGTALFNLVAGFRVLSAGTRFSALGSEQLQSQALQCFQGFDDGWAIALVFFGVHLVLLACLIFRASPVPKWLGYTLLLAGLAYSTDNLAKLFLPSYVAWKALLTALVAVPSIIGELGFAIWLLIKGGKSPR